MGERGPNKMLNVIKSKTIKNFFVFNLNVDKKMKKKFGNFAKMSMTKDCHLVDPIDFVLPFT